MKTEAHSVITQRRAYLFTLGCAVLMGFYTWHSISVGYYSDDGYIAFQYVKNLVNGAGLVYNPGERVEGYNNFLWIILLSIASKLLPSVKLLHISSALGILFGALSILLVCRFSRTFRNESGIFTLLAGAFLAAHSGLAAWATGGLETTLYAFLIFAAAYAYVSYLRTGSGQLAVPVLFALAVLTRPDALLLFGLTLLHAMFRNWRNGQRPINKTILQWVLVFTLIFLPYYAWRFAYYGYPLPNTFYAKLGGSGVAKYFRGVLYLQEYLRWFGFFVFIPAFILLLRRKREVWIDYFALLVGGYLLYLIYVGGDGLAFFRFVTYIAPLLYVLVQEGFADLYRRAKEFRFFRPALMRPAFKGAVVLGMLASIGFTMRPTIAPMLFKDRYSWYEPHSELSFPGGSNHSHSYLWFDNYFIDRQAIAAKWIEDNAPPGALVASTPAGSIAYNLNHHAVIDMLGLNDVHIAHSDGKSLGLGRAGHEKGDGKYVMSRAPDYILMGNVAVLPFPLDEKSMEEKLRLKSEHELWADPEFHKNYELRCVRLADSGVFQYFTFFQKKDLLASTATRVTTSTGRVK